MKAICTPESKHGTVMARLQHLIFVVALAHCTPPLQRAYLIALGNATLLQRSLEHNLRLPRDSIHVWTAVNATRATPDSVTLYAQHTIAHGRHDHMQLGSLPALGCLLSHMQVWQHMLTQPEDEVAIFEEDAWPREDAHMLVQGVRADAWRWASNWTLLKLTTEAGHRVVESGRWQYHTPRLASCATKGGCVTFGTRGYLLRRRGAQVLLRQVEKDKLAMALKGASPAILDLFTANMSARAAKMLKEDMDALGPVRLKDVEEAQVAVVTLTKELSNSGQITMSEGSEDGELVY